MWGGVIIRILHHFVNPPSVHYLRTGYACTTGPPYYTNDKIKGGGRVRCGCVKLVGQPQTIG